MLCVLFSWDFNFCVCSSPLRENGNDIQNDYDRNVEDSNSALRFDVLIYNAQLILYRVGVVWIHESPNVYNTFKDQTTAKLWDYSAVYLKRNVKRVTSGGKRTCYSLP